MPAARRSRSSFAPGDGVRRRADCDSMQAGFVSHSRRRTAQLLRDHAHHEPLLGKLPQPPDLAVRPRLHAGRACPGQEGSECVRRHARDSPLLHRRHREIRSAAVAGEPAASHGLQSRVETNAIGAVLAMRRASSTRDPDRSGCCRKKTFPATPVLKRRNAASCSFTRPDSIATPNAVLGTNGNYVAARVNERLTLVDAGLTIGGVTRRGEGVEINKICIKFADSLALA